MSEDSGRSAASVRTDASFTHADADTGDTLDPNVIPRIEHEEIGPPIVPRIEAYNPRTDQRVPRIEEPEHPEPATVRLPVFEEMTGEPGRFATTLLPTFDEPDSRIVPRRYRQRRSHRTEEDDFGLGGPEYDQEMPLADHIEEMIKRLAIVIVIAGSVTLVTFPFAEQIINFLWYSILPEGQDAAPRVYGPLEFLLTQIKVASLAGIVVALPVLVYEAYAFMRPGLYEHERRYYLAAIPTSLVLAVIGMAFAYFVLLPAIFTYFLEYSQEAGEIAFALGQTFDLILILMAYLAIVFQIPLLIMLAIMMGLTTRRWLAEKRLYFWGAFLGISFISSPDPTGMAPLIIALTMVGLYEGTLGILKWVGR